MMKKFALWTRFALTAGFAILLAACGGGGSSVPAGTSVQPGTGGTPPSTGGTTPGTGGTTPGSGGTPGGSTGGGTSGTGAPIVSGGAMVKGSVILNGIHFDDASAVIGDDRGRTAAQLANGMIVRVRGRSDDSVNGIADRVEVENELRAMVESKTSIDNTRSFVAGKLNVIVDNSTVFAGVADFSGLTTSHRVEVHGPRDELGNVRATRVEVVQATEGLDELRGTIASITATSFTINGTVIVNFAGATFSPAGTSTASLTPGAVVEVRGSLTGTTFTATQVDLEDAEDQALEPKDTEKTAVEGFVTGFTATPGTFKVNGRSVQTTASTRFVGGTAADLANNAKVEAEGVTTAGVLVASKIEFRQSRVLLSGKVTAMDLPGGRFTVLGQTVLVNAQTRIDTRSAGGNSVQLADLLVNECVEVKAYLDGTTVTASEVKEPSSCGKEVVQARVLFEDEATSTLRFLDNLTANLSAASKFTDSNGQALTKAQFFAAVVPASSSAAGTLVKVKGNSLASAEEAELEN